MEVRMGPEDIDSRILDRVNTLFKESNQLSIFNVLNEQGEIVFRINTTTGCAIGQVLNLKQGYSLKIESLWNPNNSRLLLAKYGYDDCDNSNDKRT